MSGTHVMFVALWGGGQVNLNYCKSSLRRAKKNSVIGFIGTVLDIFMMWQRGYGMGVGRAQSKLGIPCKWSNIQFQMILPCKWSNIQFQMR